MNQSLNLECPGTEKAKTKITPTGIWLAVLLLCGLASGTLPQTLIAFAVIVCSCALFFSKALWLAFPIMIFYYESFGTLFGMSVYRYFTLLFFIYVLSTHKCFSFKTSYVVPLLTYLIYCLAVIAPFDVRRAVFVVLDIVCIWLLVSCYLTDVETLKTFFKVYIYAAICAFVTGVIINSTQVVTQVIDGVVVEISRNYATFEDPNYMGLFYSVALFAMMSLSLFRTSIRVIFAVLLSCMILTSLSVTALIANALFWLIYLFVFRKINATAFCGIILVVLVLFGLYSYGIENPDAPVIGGFSIRIQDKLESLLVGDLDGVTTNRTNLTEQHWEYFWDQSALRMLFGLNAVSTIKAEFGDLSGVAHNEYVDLLLNIGILGTVVYLASFLSRTMKSFVKVWNDKDTYSGCVFMLKVIWIAYGFTLTMFGDYRFMLLFLL